MSIQALRTALLGAAVMSAGQIGQVHADESIPLEDVIVTAQRRVERLQDVPIAISVVSGTELERRDVNRQLELFRQIPSTSISPFSSAQAYIGMRGAVTYDDGAGMDGSVAVYVDDVYASRLSMTVFELFDLERVEVLRGPQGTLFGRNTIGGAINVVSSLPDGETDAKVRVSLGNYDRVDIGGMATGAIRGPLSVKVSFSSRDRDGWITNLLNDKKLRNENSQAARMHLRYEHDGWDVILTGDYARESLADMGRIPVRNGSGPVLDWFTDLGGDWKHSTNPTDGYTKRRNYGLTLRVNRDLGAGVLSSITGYRHYNADWAMDSVGVPQVVVVDSLDDKTRQFSQELRLAGQLGASIDYVAGLFYLREHTDRTENFQMVLGMDDRFLRPSDDLADLVDLTRQDNVTNSYAAFGQVSWELRPGWHLIGGARVTHETKDIEAVGRAGGFGIIQTTFEASGDHRWTDFSPKVALERRFGETFSAYVSASKGFKSGGFGGAPGRAEDAVTPVARETAWNVELGLKANLLDQTLYLNAAVFKTWYDDIQNSRFGPPIDNPDSSFGGFQTVNVDHAVVQGFELEGTWRPVTPLTLSAAYSYLDAEYKDSLFMDDRGTMISLDGRRMPEAPRHKAYLNATWLQPVGQGSVRLSADYSYTSSVGQDLLSLETRKPAYSLVNAQMAWIPDDHWEMAVWAKNLFNEKYISHIYLLGPGDIGVYGDPRMYGVSLTWRY
ncbi:MAG TPA: TonB-dependent receptor [Pedomonas sp.]|uniref:TonB-dependent receptor n=1 Tax=Pedomonas sp. TaxID=2976421 RepID=UPI002F423754